MLGLNPIIYQLYRALLSLYYSDMCDISILSAG